MRTTGLLMPNPAMQRTASQRASARCSVAADRRRWATAQTEETIGPHGGHNETHEAPFVLDLLSLFFHTGDIQRSMLRREGRRPD